MPVGLWPLRHLYVPGHSTGSRRSRLADATWQDGNFADTGARRRAAPSRRLEHLITRLVDSEQHRKDATLPKLCSEIDLSSGFSDCTGCQVTLPKPCSQIETSSGFADRTGSSLRSANRDTTPLATLNAPMCKLFSPPRAVITNSVECVSSGSLDDLPARSASIPRRSAASMPQGSATSLPTASLPASGRAASLPTGSSCSSKQFTVTVEEALRMLEAFGTSGNLNYFRFVEVRD